VLPDVPGRPPVPGNGPIVGGRGVGSAPGRCGLVVIIEVASTPTGASLIKSGDGIVKPVVKAAAPDGQPIVLWHGKISSGAAPPE
jgi:hypothetical protein